MRIVLRIGGSVVASPVNPALISEYANILKKLKARGHQVAVIVGGGTLARELIKVARDLELEEKAQDEIAISASRIYAQLLSDKLGRTGCGMVPKTIESAKECLDKDKIAVMGGLKPGMTTDAVAALMAEKVEADLLIKATDQEGVYDKDPRKYSDAIKLDHMNFAELSKVLSEVKHKAGIHQIIDPKAVRILKRSKARMAVVNGFKPENVLLVAEGKRVGTMIE